MSAAGRRQLVVAFRAAAIGRQGERRTPIVKAVDDELNHIGAVDVEVLPQLLDDDSTGRESKR